MGECRGWVCFWSRAHCVTWHILKTWYYNAASNSIWCTPLWILGRTLWRYRFLRGTHSSKGWKSITDSQQSTCAVNQMAGHFPRTYLYISRLKCTSQSGSSWTSAYSPNLMLQLCFQLNLVHTTMYLGENSWETPSLTGNACIQRMKKYNRFTTINLCSQSNGRLLSMALPLSFTFRIHLSISATCSFVAEVLKTVLPINESFVESNCIPIKIVCTIILPLEYNSIILFRFLLNWLSVRLGMCSTVTNLVHKTW